MPVDMVDLHQRFSEIGREERSHGLAHDQRSRQSGMDGHADEIHILDLIQSDILDDFDDLLGMEPGSDFRHHASVLLMVLDLRIRQQRIDGKRLSVGIHYPYGRIVAAGLYG